MSPRHPHHKHPCGCRAGFEQPAAAIPAADPAGPSVPAARYPSAPAGRGTTGVVLVGESDLEFIVEWCAAKEGLAFRTTTKRPARPTNDELVICSERHGESINAAPSAVTGSPASGVRALLRPCRKRSRRYRLRPSKNRRAGGICTSLSLP